MKSVSAADGDRPDNTARPPASGAPEAAFLSVFALQGKKRACP